MFYRIGSLKHILKFYHSKILNSMQQNLSTMIDKCFDGIELFMQRFYQDMKENKLPWVLSKK